MSWSTRVTAVLLVSVLLAGCSVVGGDAEDAAAGCSAERTPTPGKIRITLQVGPAERHYFLVVPEGYAPAEPHPLLLAFHGAGPTPDQRAKAEFELDEIWLAPPAVLPADLLVAAPQAAGSSWRSSAGSPDVDFAESVLADVERRLCVDPARVYATGISSGGMLATRLACPMAGRLAAVGSTIGMLSPFGAFCSDEAGPVPLVSVVGDEDRIFPVAGMASAHQAWARHNGCRSEPRTAAVPPHTSVVRYHGCTDDAAVELHVVSGMRHQQALTRCDHVPSSVRANVCFPTSIDFRVVQLAFFEAHPRA